MTARVDPAILETLVRAVALLGEATVLLTQAATGAERLESLAPAPPRDHELQAANGYGVLTRVMEVDYRSGGRGEPPQAGVKFQQIGAAHAVQLWFTVAHEDPIPFATGQIVLLTATVQR